MAFIPKTYLDHLASLGVDVSVKHRAQCKCGRVVPAQVLVDCRDIDNDLVAQDFACDGCYTAWVRASGSPEVLAGEVSKIVARKRLTATKRAALKGLLGDDEDYTAVKAGKGLQGAGGQRLGAKIVKARDAGLLRVGKARKGVITKSQWVELLGGPPELVAEIRNSHKDFLP